MNSGPILVVDDDWEVRDLLRSTLEFFGYSVVPTSNGAEAMQRAHQVTPFAITLDLLLPDVNGFEVARQLKADPRTQPVWIVAVTVLSSSQARERALAAGVDEFLVKPFELRDLVAAIQRNRNWLER